MVDSHRSGGIFDIFISASTDANTAPKATVIAASASVYDTPSMRNLSQYFRNSAASFSKSMNFMVISFYCVYDSGYGFRTRRRGVYPCQFSVSSCAFSLLPSSTASLYQPS